MVLIYGIRAARDKVHATFNSTDPISIPLIGVVPFSLDHQKLGSVDRLVLLRDENPEHISRVKVVVNLADSVDASRFAGCELAIENVEHLDSKSSFTCKAPGTVSGDLSSFGFVVFKGRDDSTTLVLPGKVIHDLRTTSFSLRDGGFAVSSEDDSIRAALEAQADSLREAASNRGDSLTSAAEAMGDSLQRAAEQKADSIRNSVEAQVQRSLQRADSLRRAQRRPAASRPR
jgi:hypothetical protein